MITCKSKLNLVFVIDQQREKSKTAIFLLKNKLSTIKKVPVVKLILIFKMLTALVLVISGGTKYIDFII